jgi:ferric-dicitrate binding protein FerR (iron transport regulator)
VTATNTTAEPARHDWVEIVATVLLAVAAVATAWSSYQANRWNGETTKATSRVNALRVDAARAQGLAQAQTQVDIATFIQWVNATATDEPELADFYTARFRPEFKPAFDAWLATDPLTDPAAPPTPFAMNEYKLQAQADVERLDAEEELATATVRRNIQRSANYVLAVVLFAVALFFAGMSAKLRGAGPRKALLAIGCFVFLGTLAWIATFPISLSV